MTPTRPRVCIIGAGAVGLVYAHFLRRAGADVSLLVKPEHAAACRDGFALHRFAWGRRRTESERLEDVGILTDPAEVGAAGFDQIWIAVASDALRQPWLAESLRDAGDATVVLVQPDLDDRALVLGHIAEARLVQGLIGFLSFQSPLPDSPTPPDGIAYALIPGAANRFDGDRATGVVALLRRGDFPAHRTHDLPATSAERSATTVPLVAGLEAAGWSLAGYLQSPWLPASIAASREALSAAAAHLGRRPAAVRHALHPLPVRLALGLAPRLAPFDLEAYLQFHFTKVGAQTRLMLDTYATHAAEAGLSSAALRALRSAL